MHDELLDIREVARRTGRAPSALRFYERKGLIRSVGRKGQRRIFRPEVLDQVALIVAGQQAGFGLDEVDRLIKGVSTELELRQTMRRKATELDGRIERLVAARDRLRWAAGCKAPRLLECEIFLGEIRAALPADGSAPLKEGMNDLTR